jgi:hypothetical protein
MVADKAIPATLRRCSGQFERSEQQAQAEHQHGAEPDSHGGGQDFHVLADQRRLLSQFTDTRIDQRRRFLLQQVQIRLGGDRRCVVYITRESCGS